MPKLNTFTKDLLIFTTIALTLTFFINLVKDQAYHHEYKRDPLKHALIYNQPNDCSIGEKKAGYYIASCWGEELIVHEDKRLKIPQSLIRELDPKKTQCYYSGKKAYMVLNENYQLELELTHGQNRATKVLSIEENIKGVPISCRKDFGHKSTKFAIFEEVRAELEELRLHSRLLGILNENGINGWVGFRGRFREK